MNNSFKIKKFVKEFKPIEIIEPFKTDIIEFSDPTEFTKYYREHEEEFSGLSTYKLNIRYKIPGYKISQKRDKENSEIRLVKDYRNNFQQNSSPGKEDYGEFLRKLEEMEKRIAYIEKYLSNDS